MSRNRFFDSDVIDREVEDYERTCTGWRMALNVTEFLYGNVDQLEDISGPKQHFLGNYVFIDMANDVHLTHGKPLHEQIRMGYYENDRHSIHKLHFGMRASRSIHNYPLDYAPQGGRHWHEVPSLKDLAIFYYGYATTEEKVLARKLQIKGKMSAEELEARGSEHPNTVTRSQFLHNVDVYHKPRCIDLTPEINALAKFQGYSKLAVAVERPLISLEMLPRITLMKRFKDATRPMRYRIKRLFRKIMRSETKENKRSSYY